MSTIEQGSGAGNGPAFSDRQNDSDSTERLVQDALRRYWRRNIFILVGLLFIWAFVGLGCGILWADWLNNFHLFGTGYPLGFWFAQQGSIVTFVLLILTYCILMNKNDQIHHEDLVAIKREQGLEQ